MYLTEQSTRHRAVQSGDREETAQRLADPGPGRGRAPDQRRPQRRRQLKPALVAPRACSSWRLFMFYVTDFVEPNKL